MPKAADYIIGGWQINAILRTQNGQPFDIRDSGGVRGDVTGDPYGADNDHYLIRSAFTNAPAGRFGNLEHNSLRGPVNKQLNMGLNKNFGIYEKCKAQFRAEFFNIFNSPQLALPVQDLNDSAFGRIRNTYGFTNRQIQVGMRLEF